MSDLDRNAKAAVPDKVVPVHEHDEMEDEEKVLAGRHDVNYPALLTKDVPGG
jgi:hypothetical protein